MPKIIVFGSFVTDLTARAPRFPAQGETVMGSSFRNGPGGKGSNQAVAAKRAGAEVCLITRLGDDIFGQDALAFYESEGLDASGVITDPAHATGAALIEVNERTAQNRIVVVLGACEHFTAGDLAASAPLIASGDILLAQLETNLDATAEALRLAKESGLVTILNPAPAAELPDELLRNVDCITPNETEAARLTGVAVDSRQSAEAAARALTARGVKKAVITLGDRGYYAFDGSRGVFGAPLADVTAVDTTGAGDAFNGAFAAGLAAGMDFFEAAAFGNTAGGLAVTRPGTAPAMPHREELYARFERRQS